MATLRKGKRYLLAVVNRKQTSYSFRKTHSKKDSETYWKNERGSEIIMAHMAVPIHVEWQSLLKRVLIARSIPKSRPLGKLCHTKSRDFNDKMYGLINIYATIRRRYDGNPLEH